MVGVGILLLDVVQALGAQAGDLFGLERRMQHCIGQQARAGSRRLTGTATLPWSESQPASTLTSAPRRSTASAKAAAARDSVPSVSARAARVATPARPAGSRAMPPSMMRR